MALPSSGAISMSQVNTELGRSATAAINLNDSTVRSLAGKSSGQVSMSDLRGRVRATVSVASTSGSGENATWLYVNYSVAAGCTTSGKWVSGGSGIKAERRSNTQYRFVATGYNGDTRRGTWRVTATPSAGGIAASVDRAITVTEGYQGCCFTGDSLVAMADGSYKRIDSVVPGDLVKTPFGHSEVEWVRLPLLMDRPLLAIDGGRCKTSGEHCIWTKHPVTGKQWWATRNMKRWLYEAEHGEGPGLNGVRPTDLIELGVAEATYATEDGWKQASWYVVEDAPKDTQLYHLYLKDHASYFVDGFLVIGELPCVESLIDWTQFEWDPSQPQKPVYMQHDRERPVFIPAGDYIFRIEESVSEV